MNLRQVELLANKTLGDSGTETIDIKVTEPITKIDLRFLLTNSAAVSENVPPQTAITKIEIVDGGRPWFSLTGRQAVALAAYQLKHFPKLWLMTMASLDQYIKLPIHFGRFVGDQQFGFDPTALRNPQIKFTYAKNTLHGTGTLQLGVFATLMDGVPSPSQCLMTRQIREFTSAASGIESTDLWIDNPYRRLFVQAGAMTSRLDQIITYLKLIADEKLIIFELEDEELADECEEKFGLFLDRQAIAVDHGDYKYSVLGIAESVQCACGSGGHIIAPWAAHHSGIYIECLTHAGAAANNIDSMLDVWGTCPEATYCYPFGVDDDPATWFPAQDYHGLKLELTQGVANHTVAIFVQQPVSLVAS